MICPRYVLSVRRPLPLATTGCPHRGHLGRSSFVSRFRSAVRPSCAKSSTIFVRTSAIRLSTASSISVSVASGCSRRHSSIAALTRSCRSRHLSCCSLINTLHSSLILRSRLAPAPLFSSSVNLTHTPYYIERPFLARNGLFYLFATRLAALWRATAPALTAV